MSEEQKSIHDIVEQWLDGFTKRNAHIISATDQRHQVKAHEQVTCFECDATTQLAVMLDDKGKEFVVLEEPGWFQSATSTDDDGVPRAHFVCPKHPISKYIS